MPRLVSILSRPSALLAIVLAAMFLLYIPALRGGFFAYDDEILLLENPTAHGLTMENVGNAFTTYDPELYVPLTLLTYQIEWSLVGNHPLLYHATNLLLHLFSTAFVFLILRRFLSAPASAICTLVFALHPIQVESVISVSARKDLLSAMFFLASAHTYLLWKESNHHRVASLALFALGLLAKVSIFPLPLCLLLFDYLRGERITTSHVREKGMYFLLAAIFVAIGIAGKSAQMSDAFASLLLAPSGALLALRHALIPIDLTIYYPFTDPINLSHPVILGSALALVVIIALGLWSARRTPLFLFAVLWFLLLLLPSFLNTHRGGELGLADVFRTSDRYAYLPLLGPIIGIGFALDKWGWMWGIVPIGTCAVLTSLQIATWRDRESIFRQVLDAGQPSYIAYTNVAGYEAKAGRLAEAAALLRQSLHIRRTTQALFNLAQIETKLGGKDEAIALYQELLGLNPHDEGAREALERMR